MPPQSDNLFLASLSPADCTFLVDRSTAVVLPVNAVLYEAESMPRHAYFVTSGIAAIVLSMDDGEVVEVGLVGREGVTGSTHLLGTGRDPTSCFVQIQGTALRIPFRELQRVFRCSESIRDHLLGFAQQQAQTLSQIAVCHRVHAVEARLAHWLLMLQDRTQADVLALTQEVLAVILGTGRPAVTIAAGNLQRQGLIEYTRGHLRILDRVGLEKAACNCYPVTQQLYADLYKRDLTTTSEEGTSQQRLHRCCA